MGCNMFITVSAVFILDICKRTICFIFSMSNMHYLMSKKTSIFVDYRSFSTF